MLWDDRRVFNSICHAIVATSVSGALVGLGWAVIVTIRSFN